MLVIGLTGGIASGKSTISKYLQKLGAVIIDADILAREVVEPGQKAWQEIRDHFGEVVIQNDQTLDRKKLAEIVFNNPQERHVLNKIVHPEVTKATRALIAQYQKADNVPLVVVDAPLLIEAGLTELVDEVWVIDVDRETQLERIIKRDNISREQAQSRLDSQMPTREKLQYADRIIDNKGEVQDTLEYIDQLWKMLVSRQHESNH